MIVIRDIRQNSPEWYQSHAGIASAGSFGKIITPKGAESGSAPAYMETLAEERRTGTMKTDGYYGPALQEGHRREPESRDCFQEITGLQIEQVGIVYADDMSCLCSPDGLIVGKPEGFETKNPTEKTHKKYLEDNKLPAKYIPQVQGSMYVTGYDHWYFMSYFPGLPPLIIKVERDTRWCIKLQFALERFNAELDEVCSKLQAQ